MAVGSSEEIRGDRELVELARDSLATALAGAPPLAIPLSDTPTVLLLPVEPGAPSGDRTVRVVDTSGAAVLGDLPVRHRPDGSVAVLLDPGALGPGNWTIVLSSGAPGDPTPIHRYRLRVDASND